MFFLQYQQQELWEEDGGEGEGKGSLSYFVAASCQLFQEKIT